MSLNKTNKRDSTKRSSLLRGGGLDASNDKYLINNTMKLKYILQKIISSLQLAANIDKAMSNLVTKNNHTCPVRCPP